MNFLLAAALPLAAPVDLDREEARRAARAELAKPIYAQERPGVVERFVRWFIDFVNEWLDRAGDASPGGHLGLVALVAVLVAAVVAIRLRVGPLASARTAEIALFQGKPLSSHDYRAAADAAAATGDWATAVRERLRAVLRSLEERDLLEARPGRTADEAAFEAGLVLPSCAEALRNAAREFDDIWYGGRPARPDADRRLRELDTLVQASRPVLSGDRA